MSPADDLARLDAAWTDEPSGVRPRAALAQEIAGLLRAGAVRAFPLDVLSLVYVEALDFAERCRRELEERLDAGQRVEVRPGVAVFVRGASVSVDGEIKRLQAVCVARGRKKDGEG